jgi:ABC-type transport system involved in multi-copper enzyme maturation permease subunit
MMALVVSELRQRMRGRRWWLLLFVWFVIIALLLVLIQHGAETQRGYYPRRFSDAPLGPSMFGSLTLLIVGLSCLIIPSLTSTAINGERDRGTLAVLQSTLFKPRDIVLAKFVGAMIISIAFLLVTLPLALWCFAEGGLSFGRTLGVYVIMVLVLALMVLIGLAASAVIKRPALSAAAAYGFVFLLTIGSPMLFGLTLLGAPQAGFERQVGWRWIILAPDPVVVLADAAPRNARGRGSQIVSDPLESIRDAVREARRAPGRPRGAHVKRVTNELVPDADPRGEPPALWPIGMTMDLLIGAAAFYLAVDRLRLPQRRLAVGERVA